MTVHITEQVVKETDPAMQELFEEIARESAQEVAQEDYEDLECARIFAAL